MTRSTTVRSASAGDAAALARLSAELGYEAPHDAMEERIVAILASPADLLLVAEDASGEVGGWLQAHESTLLESGHRVEIVGLVVTGRSRRGGLGRALVLAAEDWARGRSADVLVVRSNVQRIESHEFYPALGFSRTKTQHVYRKMLRALNGASDS